MSGVTLAKYIIEAALFSAGRSISVEEISEATGLDRRTVRKAAKELMAEYEGRDSSLAVTMTSAGFALEVRGKYARYTMKLAEQEIPRMALKTLAIIAFHQPIRQSKLKVMIGSRAYEDVRTLKEMGLITAKPDGRTFRLETSSRFPDYFGIDPDPAEIKKHLADLVGVTLREVPDGDGDEETVPDGEETEEILTDDPEADNGPQEDVGSGGRISGEAPGSEEDPESEDSSEPEGSSAEESEEPVDDLDGDVDVKHGSDAERAVQDALHDDGGM